MRLKRHRAQGNCAQMHRGAVDGNHFARDPTLKNGERDMSTWIPKEVQAGLDAARKKSLRKSSKMRVEADGQSFRVLKYRDNGFTLDLEDAPHLRGLVDLYDGGRMCTNA